MAEEDTRALTAELLRIAVVQKQLAERDTELRSRLTAAMHVHDRVAVGEGGTASLSLRKGTARVKDTAALIEWCREHRPTALVEQTVIREADKRALLAAPVDDDGVILPGVVIGDPSEVLTVKVENADAVLAFGRQSRADHDQLARAGGE